MGVVVASVNCSLWRTSSGESVRGTFDVEAERKCGGIRRSF